jgi:hypothetical protein
MYCMTEVTFSRLLVPDLQSHLFTLGVKIIGSVGSSLYVAV